MKFTSVAAIATFVATVAAQSLADLPDCALPCLAGGLSKTGCGIDIGCACKKEEFVSGAVTCVNEKCTAPADVAKAVEVAVGICKAAGVDVVIPGAEKPETTTAAPVSTESTTAAPTSTTAAVVSTTEVPVVSTTTATTAAPITTGVVPPATNGTNGTSPVVPPTNEDSAAGKVAVSGLLAAGLGLAVAFGL